MAQIEQWYNVKLLYRIKYKVDVLSSTTCFNLTPMQPNIKNIKRSKRKKQKRVFNWKNVNGKL